MALRLIFGLIFFTIGFVLAGGEIDDDIQNWVMIFYITKFLGFVFLFMAWQLLKTNSPHHGSA